MQSQGDFQLVAEGPAAELARVSEGAGGQCQLLYGRRYRGIRIRKVSWQAQLWSRGRPLAHTDLRPTANVPHLRLRS